MRLFGLVITTRKTVVRQQLNDRSAGAAAQLSTLLNDAEHPLRQAIVRVARSAVKDHIGEWFEVERARFEKLPLFEDFARQQREHDLAEAEKAQPAPSTRAFGSLSEDQDQLRYGILGLLAEHGVQVTATIADAFEGWTPAEITAALAELVSKGLVEVKHGAYSVTLAPVGIIGEQKEARNEDPDSQ